MASAAPFEFELTSTEIAELQHPAGEGGHQSFQKELISQLDGGGNRIKLDDEGFGKLIRYMTRYGSGGFQTRLRNAFERPLRKMLGF